MWKKAEIKEIEKRQTDEKKKRAETKETEKRQTEKKFFFEKAEQKKMSSLKRSLK